MLIAACTAREQLRSLGGRCGAGQQRRDHPHAWRHHFRLVQPDHIIDINKVGSQAWAVGDKVYWDNTNKRTTKTATDNTLIGVALGAVGSGADDTTGRVRLNGSF